jgi:hypothetical protein
MFTGAVQRRPKRHRSCEPSRNQDDWEVLIKSRLPAYIGWERFEENQAAGELVWDNDLRDFDWSNGTPLPIELRNRFTNGPRWVDLRELRNSDGKQTGKLFETAADLASAIRGVPKEDLLSQELQIAAARASFGVVGNRAAPGSS